MRVFCGFSTLRGLQEGSTGLLFFLNIVVFLTYYRRPFALLYLVAKLVMNEVRETLTPWDSMKCSLALSISRYSSRVSAMVVLLGLLRLLLVIIKWSMFNGYVKNTNGVFRDGFR
jgi:hypothetical protein